MNEKEDEDIDYELIRRRYFNSQPPIRIRTIKPAKSEPIPKDHYEVFHQSSKPIPIKCHSPQSPSIFMPPHEYKKLHPEDSYSNSPPSEERV
ncbi:hypothetical protein ENUP19_0161G0036 [Entamoeba nuttalli]|uniref:Uncharacterized protein n=2 Tax=Entamoeba nuttalli TaxID=412467 RepID=K2H681_ENTNP|nr:hypothetical protein ENU1_179380 [Entamoeba nuttalli P19]EKE38004.1 hypothetical protein ENU1_179380 [Entamoeba nuttalli P19]|eukprot:XP_008859657.1 hypothetical protein ENU1_179380 [Entamoeba nuttalli P19]